MGPSSCGLDIICPIIFCVYGRIRLSLLLFVVVYLKGLFWVLFYFF